MKDILSKTSTTEEKFVLKGDEWITDRLIAASKDLPVFDLPVKHIDISSWPWGNIEDVAQFAYRVKRTNDVDLQYPVIMNDKGYIMNGWHRVVKAIIEGKESVKAVRFDKTPPPDYVKV